MTLWRQRLGRWQHRSALALLALVTGVVLSGLLRFDPVPIQAYGPETEPPGANAPPVPGLGTQVQEQALYGHAPEAVVQLTWHEQAGTYGDGTGYSLRSPQIQLVTSDGTPLPNDILMSHRIPQPVFGASGREWRTPPLWGLGLAQTVLSFSGYLHDGRARTLEEAILWHDGEAELAQATFVAMTADDRAALVRFLRSL